MARDHQYDLSTTIINKMTRTDSWTVTTLNTFLDSTVWLKKVLVGRKKFTADELESAVQSLQMPSDSLFDSGTLEEDGTVTISHMILFAISRAADNIGTIVSHFKTWNCGIGITTKVDVGRIQS